MPRATLNRVCTIGHSTRTLAELAGLLKTYGVNQLIDVRTIPRSRHNPQFNKPSLGKKLRARGIGYRHMKGLGGLRHALKDSPNTGWKNLSFRGYADYMQTPEFARNLDRLIGLARKKRLALMCAEALPWRCHRSLIADALTVRGLTVVHIFSPTGSRPHQLTAFARVRHGRLTYPPAAAR